MKALLISTAMALAIGGAAMAQVSDSAATQGAPSQAPQTTQAPNSTDSGAAAPGGAMPGDTSASPQGSSMSATPGDTTGMAAPATTAPAAPSAGTDTSATVGATNYPLCRTHSQDHCRVPRAWYGR